MTPEWEVDEHGKRVPAPSAPADDLLTIGEAARILGVSVDTIRRWERDGKLAGTRTLGGQRRFRRDVVETLAKSAA